jgi:hypothetical protein
MSDPLSALILIGRLFAPFAAVAYFKNLDGCFVRDAITAGCSG